MEISTLRIQPYPQMKPPSPSSLSLITHPAPAPRVYHNAYPCLQRGKKSELAKNRDAAAFTEIMAALTPRGYAFESILFNYAAASDSKVRVDYQFIRSQDLIVMVTRPPRHDETVGTRKYVPRSGNELERQIFAALDCWLQICSRNQLRLTDLVVAAWEASLASRSAGQPIETPADFIFSQNCDARLKEWHTREIGGRVCRLKYGSDYRSIGCFLHLPRIEHLGCHLIVSFGMGCLENLIWSRIVRTRYGRWFDKPVFALAEMDLNRIPVEPVTLHFAEEIPVRLLLEVSSEDSRVTGTGQERAAA